MCAEVMGLSSSEFNLAIASCPSDSTRPLLVPKLDIELMRVNDVTMEKWSEFIPAVSGKGSPCICPSSSQLHVLQLLCARYG